MNNLLLARIDTRIASGLGHFYRSLAILECAQRDGWEVVLFGEDTDRFDNASISEFRIVDVPSDLSSLEDVEFCKRWLTKNNRTVNLVWLDHYSFQSNWEEVLSSLCTVATIDDLKRKHNNLTVVIDSSPTAQCAEYQNQQPDRCLLGLKYFLFRREFREPTCIEKIAANYDNSFKILISFGGADVNGYGLTVLKILHDTADLQGDITWIAGERSQLDFWQRDDLRVSVETSINNMVHQYRNHDIALGAAGVGMWERLSQNLVSLVWQLADNQKENFEFAKSSDQVVTFTEFPAGNKSAWVSALLHQKNSLYSQSPVPEQQKNTEIDCLGCNRVWSKLLMFSNSEISLVFKSYSMQQSKLLLTLQSLPGIRQYSRNTDTPSEKEHESWSEKLLQSDNDNGWLIYYCNKPIAWLRLSEDESETHEISFLVHPEYQGLGVGNEILDFAKRTTKKLKGYVMAENIASNIVFKKSDFSKNGCWYYWSESLSNNIALK